MQALEKRRTGGTNSECARILYQTNHPTDQEVRNVPSILKYLQENVVIAEAVRRAATLKPSE